MPGTKGNPEGVRAVSAAARPWLKGEKRQLLRLSAGGAGWAEIALALRRSERACRREHCRLKAERLSQARRRSAAAGAADRNRVLAAATMEADDWQRLNAPAGTFESRPATDKAGVRHRVRRYASNLDKYLGAWKLNPNKAALEELIELAAAERRGGRQKDRLIKLDGAIQARMKGITPDQHEAGEAFARRYLRATRSVGVRATAWVKVDGGGFDEAAAEAQAEVSAAFRAMVAGGAGRLGAGVVERVCAHDEDLASVERAMGWPRGHAIVRLREGLDDLCRHYRKRRRRR